jgi:hypothetical protein
MDDGDLKKAWEEILRAEKALKERVRKLVWQAGYSSRAHLVRHLRREEIARVNRNRYNDRKADGLCVWCGNPALKGFVHCKGCNKANAEHVAGSRANIADAAE